MACKFCNGDEELVMRSSFVNGEVKHSQICLNCLWPLLFVKIKTEGEDGILSENELRERTDIGAATDRFSDPINLQKRAKP